MLNRIALSTIAIIWLSLFSIISPSVLGDVNWGVFCSFNWWWPILSYLEFIHLNAWLSPSLVFGSFRVAKKTDGLRRRKTEEAKEVEEKRGGGGQGRSIDLLRTASSGPRIYRKGSGNCDPRIEIGAAEENAIQKQKNEWTWTGAGFQQTTQEEGGPELIMDLMNPMGWKVCFYKNMRCLTEITCLSPPERLG